MNKLFLLAGSLFISSWVMAQNPLSVHVLNLESGLPSSDVKVTLEEQKNGKWIQISEAKTNEQGRVTALFPELGIKTVVDIPQPKKFVVPPPPPPP